MLLLQSRAVGLASSRSSPNPGARRCSRIRSVEGPEKQILPGSPADEERELKQKQVDFKNTSPSDTAGIGTGTGTVNGNGNGEKRVVDDLDGPLERFGTKNMFEEIFKDPNFGKRGEEYFVYQIAAIAFLIFTPEWLEDFSVALGSASIVTGLLIVGLSANDLGRSLFPFPQPRSENTLVQSGLYRYVRHPMYCGVLLAGLGVALSTESAPRFLALWALFFILDKKASMEEKALEKKYGSEYVEFKGRVRKFFPGIY